MSETPSCTVCGSAVAFSHREYAGGGMERTIWRCTGCGATSRSGGRPRSDRGGKPRSRKPPVDEGPPDNPVIDSATAELLRRMMDS